MLKVILKTTIWVLLGIAAFLAVVVLWNLALLGLATALGLNPEHVKYASYAVLLAVMFVPKKYFRIKREVTFSGETLVHAPIEEVWAAVDLREGTGGYKKSFSAVRRVPDTNDMFELHFAPIPGDDQAPPEPLIVQRVAASAPNYLAVHHANKEDAEGLGIGASAEETFLTETEEGTHVRIAETMSHMSIWLLVTLFFVSPIKDTLKSLKHYCEGDEDTSWAAKTMDPSVSGGMQESVVVAGVTACVVVTLVAGGLIYGLLWFVT